MATILDTGFQTGTASNLGLGGIAWVNAGNAQSSNDAYATSYLFTGQSSDLLVMDNFGFSIPTTAVITGVEFRVERSEFFVSDHIFNAQVNVMRSVFDLGTAKGNDGYWSNLDEVKVYGNSSDLWGLPHLTAGDVNGSGFGCYLQATCNRPSTSTDARIDHMQLKVYYFLANPHRMVV